MKTEISKIADEFEKLKFCSTGEEGSVSNPRKDLDMAVAELLVKIEPKLSKKSPADMVKEIEENLKEIVSIRKSTSKKLI